MSLLHLNRITDSIGKVVGAQRYIHTALLRSLEKSVLDLVLSASSVARIDPDRDYNVVRIDSLDESIGFLSYPSFFDEAFPRLVRSWKVNLSDRSVTYRTYEDSFNPPVLHRKELLLSNDDPRRPIYERLTAELESQGFFEDPVRIGFKLQWTKLLAERGFHIVGHQLVPIGNEQGESAAVVDTVGPIEIARHLTALSRHNFSAPIQILQRFGFLNASRTLFDYGCGKGDDVRGLIANGISAAGWDPHYAPHSPVYPACIVNLGFVINVIEDPVERREALQRAYSLAQELLVVSTMVATEDPGKVTLFGDGVLTSRSTFQKYYRQAELREYLTTTLGEESIPVAPGIFLVFKDKEAEQRFQVGRYRSHIRIHPLARPEPRQPTERARGVRKVPPDPYATHRELLDRLWAQCLELGREPESSEVQNIEALDQALGSLRKALKLVLSHNELPLLKHARNQRSDDLKVFFALQQFQKRKPYKQLEPGLQRDVRAFFGDYASAQEHARQLLYQVAQPEILDEACQIASDQGLGWLAPGHSLQLHACLVSRLPAPLRVYVGCAAVLYGDVSEADLVKIHIRSGKVTFMRFENFFGTPLPRMTERTKINLRTQTLQLFTYGTDYPCPLLYLKSRYINEELPNFAEQIAFDQALQDLSLVDLSGYGPPEEEFRKALHHAHWILDGFRFQRRHVLPNLDDRCGKYLTYRQLIECGATQLSSGCPNLPTNPASYTALLELITNILDPIIEYFGAIELTYAFCSRDLAKRVPGRNAPALDQHAAHEKNRSGHYVCPRLGAAADFLVRDENMREVADWIVRTLPFDRLYYYGVQRPLHVSFGPENKREAIEMVLTAKGRRLPRPLG